MVTTHHRHLLRLGGPWLLGVLVYLLLWGSPGAWANCLRRSSNCTPVPPRMALCYDVGYSEMRIPNLLEHETMPEVIQQSSSWLPLLARGCQPDAGIFLCSLFAPICLDRLIYPCRSLCEAVKSSCAPIMACYGYPWPEILNCNKFPADHELCIAAVATDENSTSRRTVPRASCKEASTAREILENLCANDFAVKIRIQRNNTTTTISDFDLDPSRVEVLKHSCCVKGEKINPRALLEGQGTAPICNYRNRCGGHVPGIAGVAASPPERPRNSNQSPQQAPAALDIDATCIHNIMRGTHTGVFVVSGEVQTDKVVVNKAYAWQKKNRNLHRGVWRWKHHRCPNQAGRNVCRANRKLLTSLWLENSFPWKLVVWTRTVNIFK
ncbi:secreted frizzled-related protein 1-like [Guaruba guarouba]